MFSSLENVSAKTVFFLNIVATVPLGRFVSFKIFEIVAPPFAILTMKAHSSSLASIPFPIFQLWMSQLMIYSE